MGALCAHAAGSKSLYRNMLMRKGNRHIENNDDDDLYIMLMWRLFVCLYVTFCDHADLYIMLMWRLTWRLALPWIGKLSPKAPELSPLKNNSKIIFPFKMHPSQTEVRPNDPILRTTDDR